MMWRVTDVRTTGAGKRVEIGVVALATVFLIGAAPAAPSPPDAGGHTSSPPGMSITPDAVTASLNRALAWYRQSQVVLRSASAVTGPLLAGEDERTALRILQRAFDAAHAEAALVGQEGQPASVDPRATRLAQQRAKLEADVQRDEQEVARLGDQLARVARSRRSTVEQDLATARDRLQLDRVRLDFVSKLGDLNASLAGGPPDLPHQIQALQDAIPELRSSSAAPEPEPSASPLATSSPWPAVHRLLVLQRAHGSIDDLETATTGLARDVDGRVAIAEAVVKPLARRLQELTTETGTDTAPLADREQEFHQLLDRAKLLGAVMLPLRDQSTMLHRFGGDLTTWQRAVDAESRQTLQSLGVGLIGVVIALVVILAGAVLWRVAVVRYVTDAYRRRVLLVARNIVVGISLVLVVAFHFTSELAALVTGLGVAAAGIAFALQNVILAVAGYFTIVSPNGIRVGDRVSLQGPFGYVHGEVVDIGITRLRLHELAGDPLQPTGRIVVFPNSVVFTGSFFKHPPGATR